MIRLSGLRIGTKFTLILCAIAVLASGAVGITTYWQFNRALVDQELKQLSNLAKIKAVRFTDAMDALRADALFLSRSPVVKGLVRARASHRFDPEEHESERELRQRAETVFLQLLRAKPIYYQVRLIGLDDGGREIVRVERDMPDNRLKVVPAAELQKKEGEPYFSAAKDLPDGQIYITDVNLNREHGRISKPFTPVIRAACPVLASDGKQVAIFIINAYFGAITDELRSGLGAGQSLLVTNDQGDFLVHPDAERNFGFDLGKPARIQDDYPVIIPIFNLTNPGSASVVAKHESGSPLAIGMARAPIDPGNPDRFLLIAVANSYDDAVNESVTSRNRSLLAATIVLLIAGVTGYVVSRTVTKPLRKIAMSVEAFGRGKTNISLPTDHQDEIGILARSFADMMAQVCAAQSDLEIRAEQLAESRQSAFDLLQRVDHSRKQATQAEAIAREQSARTRAILDGATDAIITINMDGIVESFNKSAERIFGYPAADVLGKNVNILLPSPYREEHNGHIRQYLATGVSRIIGMGREVLGLRADGTTFPMHLAISEVDLGDRRLITGIGHDITDLKQAMKQLRTANEELGRRAKQIERFNIDLGRSNEELKQFAYATSHDLQEPLRKVTAFCQMLRDEYVSSLDENAQTYIDSAVDGAMRMKNLIQDLLAYSRVETQGKPPKPTDADDACAEAIDNLAVAICESGAEVTRDPLPMVIADRAQLVRLFQNLIGNAIKYRGHEPSRIQVSATEADDVCEFRVQDNGIGIDPQYHQRIFVIFQRLHARQAYSGTGIGLAVCKRIVERAGGHMWVESNVGTGSTFCFTLASVQSDVPQGELQHV